MSEEFALQIDPATRREAARVFAALGLSLDEAVNLFLCQSIMLRGLPFEPRHRICNAATKAALAEARDIMGQREPALCCSSSNELFCELDKKCSN